MVRISRRIVTITSQSDHLQHVHSGAPDGIVKAARLDAYFQIEYQALHFMDIKRIVDVTCPAPDFMQVIKQCSGNISMKCRSYFRSTPGRLIPSSVGRILVSLGWLFRADMLMTPASVLTHTEEVHHYRCMRWSQCAHPCPRYLRQGGSHHA